MFDLIDNKIRTKMFDWLFPYNCLPLLY